MPQMAPIMWMPLYMLSLIAILLIINKIYFTSMTVNNSILTKPSFKSPNWTW
uniref:ATP synthase F0 subunit 8 n=1 Tax=Gondogeneia antarctica TaxID=1109128 RepID=G8IQP6_GONAN|nr:ATP synthase F0 subunit 8 [Gondogeneia antarctica]